MRNDIFIIHSKSDRKQDLIARECIKLFHEASYSVWLYSHWRWQEEDRVVYRTEGTNFDMHRFASGRLDVFRHRAPGDVDYEALMEIFDTTRLVIYLNQERWPPPTEGVNAELDALSHILRKRRSDYEKRPPLIFLYCNPSNPGEGYEYLEDFFEDNLKITDRINIDISCIPASKLLEQPRILASIHALVVLSARYLLVQRADFTIQVKANEPENFSDRIRHILYTPIGWDWPELQRELDQANRLLDIVQEDYGSTRIHDFTRLSGEATRLRNIISFITIELDNIF